jgi:cobalt/nickel transport system permease protein
MHLAEGTLPLGHALAWTLVTLPLLAWSVANERAKASDADEPARQTLVAGATSLLFAATLLPLPVPVAGVTSHICLTPLLGLLIGLRRTIWPTCFVLALQALFFAHGGLTTLGVNTLTLGVIGPASAIALARVLRSAGLEPLAVVGIACALADLSVYLADAGVLALGLAGAVAPARTLSAVIVGFAPVQLPLAVLEALACVAIVRALARRRPDLLPSWLRLPVATPTTSVAPGSTTTLLVVLVTLASASGCSDSGYSGLDATVFAAAAEAGGQPPTASLIDGSTGELGLALTILVLFGFGFVAGRSYERLLERGHASSR